LVKVWKCPQAEKRKPLTRKEKFQLLRKKIADGMALIGLSYQPTAFKLPHVKVYRADVTADIEIP
jgi:hypothetical protein